LLNGSTIDLPDEGVGQLIGHHLLLQKGLDLFGVDLQASARFI
jgi:hypothetical protein